MAQRKIITSSEVLANPEIAKFLADGGVLPPKAAAAAAIPPLPTPAPQEPQTVEELAEKAAEEPATDPFANYLEDLKRLSVTKEQAAEIIDAMLFKGFYEEDIAITKKLVIRFRTRLADASDRLNEAINRESPQFNGTFFALVGKYNLAASLVAYGPHKFDPSTPDGVEKTLDYIQKKIPLPVYQLLLTKLSKFDEKLTTIMREGCVDHFF